MTWVKGQSGNPQGRPKGSKTRSLLLRSEIIESVLTPERIAMILEAMYLKVLKEGDATAAKVLLEFRLGKPKAHVEITSAQLSRIVIECDPCQTTNNLLGSNYTPVNTDSSHPGKVNGRLSAASEAGNPSQEQS